MATQIQTVPHDANSKPAKDISDTAALTSPATSTMQCPDPSAHKTKDTSLQDHASAAALHGVSASRSTASRKDINPLGPDGKLSSAGAATSLRHANAQELPSYPVVGIDTHGSANTAANLANANQKSPEWWKPEHSLAAGKAALLANGYKMEPLWQPQASSAGSKAALLAHKGGANLNLWTPHPSAAGQSAATLAFQRQKPAPEVDYGHTADGRRRALVAATGAVSSSGRRRAQSTPVVAPSYPDSANSAQNALSAATLAHRPSMKAKVASPLSSDSNRLGSDAMEAARIQHSKGISREMYTSTPPVALEVEEKKKQDALRASAISMAKQMYNVQQRQSDHASASRSEAQAGANVAQGQYGQQEETNIKAQAMRYIGVQEAAQKLAAERLAKIGFDENAAYRSYYGYEKPTRARLSLRLSRRRSSSNPETAAYSDDDELQSRKIRSQMSQFNKHVAEVDAKKREQDRRYLLAAAQRKVQAQMQGLDKKIFDETGHMSPAMIEDWDAKARAKAAAASEARMENHGKVHIGHGKYVDQADIDAVALARVQPTLDDITEKTEKRRAQEEERRLDLEEKKREARREKERAAEIKAEEKRFKDAEKRASKKRTTEEKTAAKEEKEAGAEMKAEEARMTEVEEHRSEEPTEFETVAPADAARPTIDGETPAANAEIDSLYRDPTPAEGAAHAQGHEASGALSPTTPTSPTSPTSPKSESKGLKGFLNKFKRRSKHSASSADSEKPGFIGGAALRGSSTHSHRDSVPSSPPPEPTRISDSERRYSDVSSISSQGDDVQRGRTTEQTSGMSPLSSRHSGEFEEAMDTFDEELAPPPTFTTSEANAVRKGSPNRDSKFHEVGI